MRKKARKREKGKFKVKGHGEHGAKPHTPSLLSWGSAGRKASAFPVFGRGRERAMSEHGAKPHTPFTIIMG